jgi:XRE family aerobic/anaerobic benzoate catabolism transcriptional regulator
MNAPHKHIDPEAADLMARVGARVRRARELKGISRRVLSETSGVSPRYLAQLEAGEGNISIALLARVAEAVDHRIEWLVSEDDPAQSDSHRIAQLYRISRPEVQAQVRDTLLAETQADRAERICLIGLRGAGKSTLGRMAARTLEVPFVELNKEIEEQASMPISEVMALYGPEGYRTMEAEALNNIITQNDRMILAVAGGIVTDPDVFETLLARCHTVWLKASPQDHMNRVRAQGDMRPMAGQPQAMAQLKAILSARESQYARADAVLDTSGRTPEGARQALLELITQQGFMA